MNTATTATMQSARSSSNSTATTTSRVLLGRRGMMTSGGDFNAINNSRRALLHNSTSQHKRKTLTLRAASATASGSKGEVSLLDYGAGNVRSVRNAMQKLGYTVKDIKSPEDILAAKKLVFPGVGAYGSAM